MTSIHRQAAQVVVTMLLAVAASGFAQAGSPRLRGGLPRPAAAPPAPVVVAAPAALVPSPQPAAPAAPLSLLQQPAHEAKIVFSGDRLSIQAENASLTAILRQFAATSGMHITGLGSDERVFGTFGPGPARDVLADLLNGTAYNQMLLGDLSNGAPRELILTPATRAGEAPQPAAAAQPASDDAGGDQEVSDVAPPPPPDVTPVPQTPPGAQGAQGVRTPQQLFEQLQQMRQAQQQQLSQQQDSSQPQ